MVTRVAILDAALEALREGDVLTLDAVARRAGLTKPGVVHHFPTKEILAIAVVDRVIDLWEADLLSRVSVNAGAGDRLRAYVEFALTADLDASDLALLSDVRLREKLIERWSARLDPWFGQTDTSDPDAQARVLVARFIADGAWFDRALGIITLTEAQRAATLALALTVIDQGDLK